VQRIVLALLCAEFCSARAYLGGFEHKGECYCFERVERDVPPAMLISGSIKEKLNQETKWSDAGAGND
jgi:hypothetical protein